MATFTTLAASIDDTATSLTVADASAFPADPQFPIQIDLETIYVGAVSGNTWSELFRGSDGTEAAAHSLGTPVYLYAADPLAITQTPRRSGGNLLLDPSFEGSPTTAQLQEGWHFDSLSSVIADASAPSGTHVLQVLGDGVTANPGAWSGYIPVVAGEWYRTSVWVNPTTITSGVLGWYRVYHYDAAFGNETSLAGFGTGSTGPQTWQKHFEIPSGAHYLRARLYAAGTPASGDRYLYDIPGIWLDMPTTMIVASSDAGGFLPYGVWGEVEFDDIDDYSIRLREGAASVHRPTTPIGYAPQAVPMAYYPVQDDGSTRSVSLPSGGGAIAVPVVVPSAARLDSFYVRNNSGASRTIDITLYQQNKYNTGTLTRRIWTSSAAVGTGLQAVTIGNSITIAPGTFWLVVRNLEASNTFLLGQAALPDPIYNNARTKTLGTGSISSLDLITGWTRTAAWCQVGLRNRVLGESTP